MQTTYSDMAAICCKREPTKYIYLKLGTLLVQNNTVAVLRVQGLQLWFGFYGLSVF